MPVFVKSQEVVLPYKPIFWVYLTGIVSVYCQASAYSLLTRLSMQGICGFIAQFLMAKALQIERVGRALLGNYTQLPWALLLQYFIFGEVMDLLSTLGAVIIMGSTCWVVLTRQKDKVEIVKQKERTLSFSGSVAGGDFARDEFDSDEEDGVSAGRPQRPTQVGGSARYTAISDQEVVGMEAGLLPNGLASAQLSGTDSNQKQSPV
jgi:hypothetical protein